MTPEIVYELDAISPIDSECGAYGCADNVDWILTTKFIRTVILRTGVCHGHANLIDEFLKSRLKSQ